MSRIGNTIPNAEPAPAPRHLIEAAWARTEPAPAEAPKREVSYEPFEKDTANATDRVAWVLCQIIDDDAPMRWTRYRFAAMCIARNPELMADLRALGKEPR